MPDDYSDERLSQILPKLMAERGLGVRELARRAEVSHAHLSRVIREDRGKHASMELIERLAGALDLSPDFFREYREAVVGAELRSHAALLNRVYRGLRR
ncbi:MAG: helix-turn-helix domain-containing protein [Solirubrobacteraceae bacterium]